jgi:hypothetical protein
MKQPPPPENPFLSIMVNIVIPVVVLNKGGKFLSPRETLLIALLFPLIYLIQDYVRRKHKNYVSLLGMVNILLTGGLAFFSIHGIWFAVKEASLPAILGILVLFSAWTKSPAARVMFCNPHVLNMVLIEERLTSRAQEPLFVKMLRRTTLWLSLSFFVSALLNFVLAARIFKDIDPALTAAEQETVLNSQLADMTWMSMVVIALPLIIFSGILIYYFLHRLSKLIDVPIDQLMKT